MSKRSLLDAIEIKSPCSENWDAMRGDERVRFCAHCSSEVNNLSSMTRKQALKLIRRSNGRLCVRYVKNPASEQPVFAAKLYRLTRRAGIAAGVLGASLSLSTLTYAQGSPVLLKRSPEWEAKVSRENAPENSPAEKLRASLSGFVIDPQGAVVPNVQVTLTDQKTGRAYTTVGNEAGFFEFKDLEAGVYDLKSEGKLGFKEKEIKAVEIRELGDLKQNITLDVNDIAMTDEVVTVEADSLTVMGGIALVSFQNPLHAAVSSDDPEAVRNLIANGANVNQRDENYNHVTPLFLAVENGNVEIAQTLLDFGAKANTRDDEKQTPLMRLDEDASAALVLVLIKHGAKMHLVDRQGNTPLILAARSAPAQVLEILLRNGADLNAQNKAGRTALMEAAEADNAENVRALLAAGARVDLLDKQGETAWDLTTDDAIEDLLEFYGASPKEDTN